MMTNQLTLTKAMFIVIETKLIFEFAQLSNIEQWK